ncbi:MAG: VOC family protein [Ignavibacteriaceae bacterium]|nr:VOC family protein [Ignavibacteriaceae bacterium]
MIKGIGGIFIRANNPKLLAEWYANTFNLRFDTYEEGKTYGMEFVHQEGVNSAERKATIFSFNKSKEELPEKKKEFELNLQVENLTTVLLHLEELEIPITGKEESEYGKFVWITDPEGNKLELWQAPDATQKED